MNCTVKRLDRAAKRFLPVFLSYRLDEATRGVLNNTNNDMYNKENLTKLKTMNGLAPEVMQAFWAFDKAAVAEGAIPVKYKELIAVAVALTTQCPYCIDIHTGNARKAGANDTELSEAAMVAAALRAGAAVTHATHALSH